MKTAVVTLFFAICLQADLFAAPDPGVKIRGNWLSYHHYGMQYYRIRSNSRVDCFYRDCTNRGTRLRGHYTQNGDTIALFFPNDTTVLFLYGGALYPFRKPVNFPSGSADSSERTGQRSTARSSK